MAISCTRNLLAGTIAVATASLISGQAVAQVQQSTTTRYEQTTGRNIQAGEWVFVPPLVTVFRRPRPELDALGIMSGGFLIQPQLELSVAFNDNVFADETNEVDDTIFFITPSVRAQSQWSRHLVGAEAYARIRRYADTDSENTEDVGATVFGRYDIQEDQNLFGSFSASRSTEGRGSPDNDIAVPIEVERLALRAGYSKDFARGNLRLEAEGRDLSYSPSTQRDRDRQELEANATFSYMLTPRITPFVTIGLENRKYDLAVDFNGFNRDSDAYKIAAGARVEISDIMVGELALGASRTNFDDPVFDDVTTFNARGDLRWNVTTLTSLIGRLERSEEATTQIGASSKTVSVASLRAEHELLRTLLLYGQVRYIQEDFRTNREDDGIGADVGAEWLLNRFVTAFADYHYDERDSNIVGEDFTNNVLMIGARLQY